MVVLRPGSQLWACPVSQKSWEGLWAPLLGTMQQDELCSALWLSKHWARAGESADDLRWDCGWVKSLMSKAEFLLPFFIAGSIQINELYEKMVWPSWTCPGSKTQLCGTRNPSNYFWYWARRFTLLQKLHLRPIMRSPVLVSQIQAQDEMEDGWRGRINLVSVGHTLSLLV